MIAILVGFGAVTPFIAAAMLNQPIPSAAGDGGARITASIEASPLPQHGETIVQRMQDDALQSSEPRLAADYGAVSESNPRRLTRGVRDHPTAEVEYAREVFLTELQNVELASHPQIDAQPLRPETELAAGPSHSQPMEPIAKPRPRPRNLVATRPSTPTRSARVRTDVRMRSGPRNSAAVVTVVRGGSEVKVVNCKYWCEVTFNGKRGWIYKKFIRGAGS